jgi:transcriptional regulator with XRE-family HTH domain
MAGISVTALAFYETGKRRPPTTVILKLADALDLSQDERVALLEELGHRVYPTESFSAGKRLNDLQGTLQRILEERGVGAPDLAKELGMSVPMLESELGKLLPNSELYELTVHKLALPHRQETMLHDAWLRQALLVVPSPASKEPTPTSEAAATLAALLRGWQLGSKRLNDETVATLHALESDLGLSHAELARMLDAPEEDVLSWLQGTSMVPLFVIARAKAFRSALDTLKHLFRAERLREVLRRPADLFGGRPAIDLIRNGELQIVAEKYDRALEYSR